MLTRGSSPVSTGYEAGTPNAASKVQPIAELGRIAQRLRAQGKTVALCHGVFDLLHLGHIRHFESARREADCVFVTVTADAFVNKGPGRPVFPEAMRAEMIASVACVDYVGVNSAADAEPVLNAIQPNAYVKGSDYENAEDDITGRIRAEQAAVERYGGRIVFTREVTFSSSNLINRHLDVYDSPLRDYLEKVRTGGGASRLAELVERVRDMHVVFVGDTIIDEYQYVSGLGKASKEHLVATQFQSSEQFAGGVIAAANHAASFCRSVEIVTTLGADDSHDELIRSRLAPNVTLTVATISGRPTTRKLRFVDAGYLRKLFEVYFMDDSPLDAADRTTVDGLIRERAHEADVVVVTDFGHGLIGSSTVKVLSDSSKFLAVNAQSNSGNHGYNLITKYPRADYICIDAPEARLAAADKFGDIVSVIEERLCRSIDCGNIVVTHGVFGCYPFARGRPVTRVPAFTKTVVDTVGAGDAFFAVTAPLVAAGGDIEDVAFLGNAAGAIKVGIVGHRSSVEKIPLLKYVTTLLK